MRATIKDIANYAGVSKALVSMYLNNSPLATNKATRRRIEEAIEKFHYRPSAMARALNPGKNNFIGIIKNRISTFYSGFYIENLFQELEKHDCRLLISLTYYDPKREMQCLLDIAQQTAGAFYSFFLPPDWEVPAALQNYPLLVQSEQRHVNSCSISTATARKHAVAEFQRCGCRKILSLYSGWMHRNEIEESRSLSAEYGLDYVNCDFQERHTPELIWNALREHRADALIARNSYSTARFLRECEANGIRNLPKIVYDYSLPYDFIDHEAVIGAVVSPFKDLIPIQVRRMLEIIRDPVPVQALKVPAEFLAKPQLHARLREQIADPYYSTLVDERSNAFFHHKQTTTTWSNK